MDKTILILRIVLIVLGVAICIMSVFMLDISLYKKLLIGVEHTLTDEFMAIINFCPFLICETAGGVINWFAIKLIKE